MESKDKLQNPARRRAIGIAAATATIGVAGGLAGGVALMAASAPPAVTSLNGLKRFDGKVVLITGATSGIGRAAAKAFAHEGGKVAFCGRRLELGQELEREIKATGGKLFSCGPMYEARSRLRASCGRR